MTAGYRALTESAGLLDLGGRGRLCLVGADRAKFLHGQVTSDILKLRPGHGTRATLVNAKGRVEADLFIHSLADELLLDFEPGLSAKVQARLQKYIIAEDVQVVDVAAIYGLLTVQGPGAEGIARGLGFAWPAENLASVQSGETLLMRVDRFGTGGFDLFAPADALPELASKIVSAGALPASEQEAETVRIENGIPRFGFDFDETNLAPETGLERIAISYAKGCYIGQEVIARIRTYGQVAKALRILHLEGEGELPPRGTKLFRDGKEAGHTASFTFSPKFGKRVGFAYVRKESNGLRTALALGSEGGAATVAGMPFER